MQNAQSNWVFLTWSLCFISLLFVTILLYCFCFVLFCFVFIFYFFLFFWGFALHNIHVFHAMLFLVKNKTKQNKRMRKRKENCVLHYFSWIWNQGWSYYLYITCLCTLFSLNKFILLHLTSFSFVVHVMWELFIVFYFLFCFIIWSWSWSHMLLIVRTKKS